MEITRCQKLFCRSSKICFQSDFCGLSITNEKKKKRKKKTFGGFLQNPIFLTGN